MFALNKNLLIILITLLALASLLLFGYLRAAPKREDAPHVQLVSSPSQGAADISPSLSAMATNVSNIPDVVSKETTSGMTAAIVSLSDIKACMTKPVQQIGICYDALFREFFKTNTTADALKIVAHYESTDSQLRYACHPVVHAIGRETFAKTRTVQDSFAACDQTCHSGCYHGAMERFIRGDQNNDENARHVNEEELEAKTVAACPSGQSGRFRFQCLHGLGHALLFSLDYQLEQTLAACDKLAAAWDRSSCWGGAFMENLFPSDPTKSDVSPSDYHYPCDKLNDQYKSDCYVMQTTRMTAMGLDAAQLFAECRKAGAYILSCIQSIGRDLSNDARIKDPRLTAEKCELGQNKEERQSCTRGVIYALLDNTWDGRYAFPFCQAFVNQSDQAYCTAASARYLVATYDKTKEMIFNDCIVRIHDQAACKNALKEL